MITSLTLLQPWRLHPMIPSDRKNNINPLFIMTQVDDLGEPAPEEKEGQWNIKILHSSPITI